MSRGMQNQLASGVANMHSQLGKGIVVSCSITSRFPRLIRWYLSNIVSVLESAMPEWNERN